MGHFTNITGNKFGKLTVINREQSAKNGRTRWLCICECGNKRIVLYGLLKNKIITQCVKCDYKEREHGREHQDFTGQKIGNLTVLKRAKDKINSQGHPVIMWECQCECSNIVYRTSFHLRRGRCTCLECKAKLDRTQSFKGCGDIYGVYWSSTKRNAKLRGIEFSISIEYVWNIFLQQNKQCSLTGIELVFAKNKKEHYKGATTASLDRIDSTKGYIEGNIQWVHKWINVMKNDFTYDEFLYFCTQVVNHDKEKNNKT